MLKPRLADKAIGAVGTEKGYILKRDAKDVAEQIIIMKDNEYERRRYSEEIA